MSNLKEVNARSASSTHPLDQAQRDELYALLTKVISDPSLVKSLQGALNTKAQSNQAQIIRMCELSKRLGLAKSTIYGMIAAGKFPKPFSINGGKAAGWLSTTIDQWCLDRAAAQVGVA